VRGVPLLTQKVDVGAQDEYRQKIERMANADLRYWAVALYGDKKAVNKLCGSLPLFRG